MRAVRLLICISLGLLAAGCGPAAVDFDTSARAKKGDASAKFDEGVKAWENREDRAAVDAAIAAWVAAAEIDPTRADIQLELAYAYYFLANAHLQWEEDNDDAMTAAYEKGYIAGKHAIELTSPEFAAKIRNGESWEAAIPSIGKEGVPALYWFATNRGKWALQDGFTTILSEKDRIAAIMEHCKKLDETFWYGAPHRYFGVYRTKIPFPGGDLPVSKQHFDRAVEINANYLDTKVLFAKEYAVKEQDEELFKKLLNEVIATPDDVVPELVPENRNSKRMAKKLLDDIEDYF